MFLLFVCLLDQILKGTKHFVLFKVLDGDVNGRLGLCPLCQGQMKYEEEDYESTVHCSGRFDEDIGRRIAWYVSTGLILTCRYVIK